MSVLHWVFSWDCNSEQPRVIYAQMICALELINGLSLPCHGPETNRSACHCKWLWLLNNCSLKPTLSVVQQPPGWQWWSVSGRIPVNLFLFLWRYLALVESLPTYGVHYYPVKVKAVPRVIQKLNLWTSFCQHAVLISFSASNLEHQSYLYSLNFITFSLMLESWSCFLFKICAAAKAATHVGYCRNTQDYILPAWVG